METIPKWALDDYPGAEQDFSLWLEQQFLTAYHSTAMAQAINGETGEILDDQIYQRTKAVAKFQAMNRTLSLKGTIERAQVWQLYQANETGWFRLLPPEFDTIEELMANMVEAVEEGTSEYYDLSFLVKEILPMIRSAGIPVEIVMGMTMKISKARAAVPVFRELIRNSSAGDVPDPVKEQELKDAVISIVEKISSNLPVREFRAEMQVIRGKVIEAPDPCEMRRYVLVGGRNAFIIQTIDHVQLRAIEIALRGLTNDPMVGDVKNLLEDVQLLIGGKVLE